MSQYNHGNKHNQEFSDVKKASIKGMISALAQQTLDLGEATSLKGFALFVSAEGAVSAPGTPLERLPPGVIGVTYPDLFVVGPTVDAFRSGGPANRQLRALLQMARRIQGRYPSPSEYERILRLVDGFLVAAFIANLEFAVGF